MTLPEAKEKHMNRISWKDLRALTLDFYSRFYHVTPSAAQIDHVLAGRD